MDLMHRCENQSWATVGCIATTDRHGNDVALVVAKVSYAVTLNGRVSLDHRPVRWSDVPDGRGGLKFPSDLANEKPGTDVGLVGTAHPPGGKGIERWMAWVQAGPLKKVIQVSGARKYTSRWGRIAPDEPSPLAPTPLGYDFCFGGSELPRDEGGFATNEPHNPIGRGFHSDETRLLGQPAPQLEPVLDPLAPTSSHACHGCFAPLQANWEPRRSRIGTRDLEWLRKRAPTVPVDFDARFHTWAVPELHSDKPLLGNEAIEVAGVLREGPWRFSLPRYSPKFGTPDGDSWREVATHLDSVLIDADARVIELSWRAAVPLPTPWERLARIRVWSETPMPKEHLPARPNAPSAAADSL